MTEKERQPELAHERKEYSFGEGVNQALTQIEKLLATQDYVVVGVAGPMPLNINVGKTRLVGKIGSELSRRNIPSVSTYIGDTVDEHIIKQLLAMQGNETKKGVIILAATSSLRYRRTTDRELQTIGGQFGLPLSKINVRILIYRPDREPHIMEKQNADIVIRNEEARDK